MTVTNLPLLIDVHSHAHRGREWQHKGTIETETRSALVSGFGTVISMPNSCPPLMTQSELARVRERARKETYCDTGFHFGSVGDNFTEFPSVWPLVYGLKIYLGPTTGDNNVSLPTAKRIIEAWSYGKPILVHCEGADLTYKVIKLAEELRRRIHICHVSLAEQVEVIRKAKYNGVGITAEVCPHHLVFTENDRKSLGGYGIMKPPLASEADVEALWKAVGDGTIDIIATDHAPHSRREKEGQQKAFGVISEPAFSVLWARFAERKLPIDLLTKLMSLRPARIFGVPILTDSNMEVDLDDSFVLEPEMIQSTARSSYEGMRLKGRIRQIRHHGKTVYKDGEFIGREGRVI